MKENIYVSSPPSVRQDIINWKHYRKLKTQSRHTYSTKYHKLAWSMLNIQQELSYRQQIARKLRTQYAEGIYRHKYYTVTLKSRLNVTQDQWKRNHWIDHTRLRHQRDACVTLSHEADLATVVVDSCCILCSCAGVGTDCGWLIEIINHYIRRYVETCESEISVPIESRLESADSRLQLEC